MKKRWLWIVIVAVLVIALWIWSASRPKAALEVVRPLVDTLHAYIEEQAVTELSHDYLISMPISGWLQRIELREGDMVTAFSHARWTKNLAGGAPVTLNIKNKAYHGQADIVSEDKEAIASELQRFLNVVRSDARFYQVTFDEDGRPKWEDVQRAAQDSTLLKIQINGQDS